MSAYYNEIDPFAAAWLRELIKAGHIASGFVDERSIEDVRPEELDKYTQCHFFAGIGVWSYALRQAGWPDDRPIWTGSCPCQPFSAAGKGAGFDDERHLWPSFYWLIEQCKPAILLGEQVASKAAEPWIDLVQADLEALGYAFGCIPFPSAGVGAPHLRDRAYWVANSSSTRGEAGLSETERGYKGESGFIDDRGGELSGTRLRQEIGRSIPIGLADTASDRRIGEGSSTEAEEGREQRPESGRQLSFGSKGCAVSGELETPLFEAGRLAESNSNGQQEGCKTTQTLGHGHTTQSNGSDGRPQPTNGFWADADWLGCRDGKWRPVEPAFKQMVDGIACAMVYLRDARTNKEKIEEVKYAAANDTRSDEILRAVREGAAPETVWLQIGRQIGFYEATLLFAFLLEQAGKLGHFIDCAAQGGSQACSKALREMRKNEAFTRPSHRRKYSQQRPKKFADALSELPQAGSLEVIRTLNGSPLVDGATNRMGRLRGYGNAINAQAAQAFIESVMEVI